MLSASYHFNFMISFGRNVMMWWHTFDILLTWTRIISWKIKHKFQIFVQLICFNWNNVKLIFGFLTFAIALCFGLCVICHHTVLCLMDIKSDIQTLRILSTFQLLLLFWWKNKFYNEIWFDLLFFLTSKIVQIHKLTVENLSIFQAIISEF